MSDLFLQHRRYLSERAVSLEVSAERGYRSIFHPDQLAGLGFKDYQQRCPGLLIPTWNVRGEVAFWQLKPDYPREERRKRTFEVCGCATGWTKPEAETVKPIKFEHPAGTANVLDVPVRVLPVLGDPSVPLIFTEGPVKADALVSAGHFAIDVLGVWSWCKRQRKTGDLIALSDFDSIALKGREVSICFDSDVVTNDKVGLAERWMGSFLVSKGVSLRLLRVPLGQQGEKQGIDDLIAAGHDLGELQEAIPPASVRRRASKWKANRLPKRGPRAGTASSGSCSDISDQLFYVNSELERGRKPTEIMRELVQRSGISDRTAWRRLRAVRKLIAGDFSGLDRRTKTAAWRLDAYLRRRATDKFRKGEEKESTDIESERLFSVFGPVSEALRDPPALSCAFANARTTSSKLSRGDHCHRSVPMIRLAGDGGTSSGGDR